jgi:hypothetical protein
MYLYSDLQIIRLIFELEMIDINIIGNGTATFDG